MFLSVMLLAASAPMSAAPVPPCQATQLRLSLDGRDGDFNGMTHAGIEVSIRNLGQDCTMAALPAIRFLDRRGRPLPALRTPPVGMHPGPMMIPVRLAAGHRAATDLRWIPGPVFPSNRRLHAASISLNIGGQPLRAPVTATLYGETGKPLGFDQSPLRAVEGMAAD